MSSGYRIVVDLTDGDTYRVYEQVAREIAAATSQAANARGVVADVLILSDGNPVRPYNRLPESGVIRPPGAWIWVEVAGEVQE